MGMVILRILLISILVTNTAWAVSGGSTPNQYWGSGEDGAISFSTSQTPAPDANGIIAYHATTFTTSSTITPSANNKGLYIFATKSITLPNGSIIGQVGKATADSEGAGFVNYSTATFSRVPVASITDTANKFIKSMMKVHGGTGGNGGAGGGVGGSTGGLGSMGGLFGGGAGGGGDGGDAAGGAVDGGIGTGGMANRTTAGTGKNGKTTVTDASNFANDGSNGDGGNGGGNPGGAIFFIAPTVTWESGSSIYVSALQDGASAGNAGTRTGSPTGGGGHGGGGAGGGLIVVITNNFTNNASVVNMGGAVGGAGGAGSAGGGSVGKAGGNGSPGNLYVFDIDDNTVTVNP